VRAGGEARGDGLGIKTPEGNVELVAEGPRDAVEALIKWCQTGPPHAHVTNVRVTEEPYSGSYKSFDTRYAGGD